LSAKTEVKDFYDVIVIGGGIVGCGIFRDLALHGSSCLLLEKGDFAAQTSARSSKMLHGGIRYLEHFEFNLVKEALHEKNLWLKLAPHLCQELPFHLPIYKESKYPLFMLRAGLLLYDFLSGFQNSPFSILNAEKTLEHIPGLKKEGLRGSGVYYDAIVDDAKLALECLYDGLYENNGQALNYFEVTSVTREHNSWRVEAKDQLNGDSIQARAKHIVVATGPFTDTFLGKLNFIPWEPKLLPSKGIHIWLEGNAMNLKGPMVLQTYDERIIFVIPQRGHILVGTTESKTQEDFFNIEATQEEVDYLLENLKAFFPDQKINDSQILSAYAGIRPLVRGEGSDRGKTSRVHALYRPHSHAHVIVGGKYTTFRVMAQEITEQILSMENKTYNPLKTLAPLRIHSQISPFAQQEVKVEDLKSILANERVRTYADIMVRRLGVPAITHWEQNRSLLELIKDLPADLIKDLDMDGSHHR
jgi:glycerol-3-phosphate dehydrogenase